MAVCSAELKGPRTLSRIRPIPGPTFWKGLRGPRGRPDPQNDRFPTLSKLKMPLPKYSHVWAPPQKGLGGPALGLARCAPRPQPVDQRQTWQPFARLSYKGPRKLLRIWPIPGPTFWKVLRSPRGRPDPQNDRFPTLSKLKMPLPNPNQSTATCGFRYPAPPQKGPGGPALGLARCAARPRPR